METDRNEKITRLFKAAIITCIISAVSMVPALMIASVLQPQPDNNSYTNNYQTTNTTVTNIMYYTNGSLIYKTYHSFSVSVYPNFTRTFIPFLDIDLENQTSLTLLRGQTNITISSCSIDWLLIINGTEYEPYAGIGSINSNPPGMWIGDYWATPKHFPTGDGCVARLGIWCYDGLPGTNPANLKADIVLFYEQEHQVIP